MPSIDPPPADAPAIRLRRKLPFGHLVEFEWTAGRVTASWATHPRLRTARAQRRLRDAYELARTEFVEMVATHLNGNVLVADIDGRIETVAPAVRH